MTDTPIGPEQRRRLAAIADVVFPRTAEMPSASDVDASGRLLDRVLRAVPSLVPGLRDALSAAGGTPENALERLRDADPRLFKTLFLVLASAYYVAPEVQERTGYHGQDARKIDFFEVPAYLEDGSLDRVIARGPRWVDADDEAPRA